MMATTGGSEQLPLSHRCPSCLQPGALHAKRNALALACHACDEYGTCSVWRHLMAGMERSK